MSKKRMSFPMDVPSGSVTVKIYKVRNKAYRKKSKTGRVVEARRFGYTVSYFAGNKRCWKMFADFQAAYNHAKSQADKLSQGEHDALRLGAEEARAYVNCEMLAKVTGLPLEVLVKDYIEAWTVLGGRATLPEAAREYVQRHGHIKVKKTVPQAVEEMIAQREKDGTSDAYLKVLKVYLGQFKEKIACNVGSVTTAMLTGYFRELPVSPRSKNNARATIGAFFKFCKENGWLPRDHEGIVNVPKFKDRGSEVIEIYAPKELVEILTVAREEMIPFLTIGAFAGLRTAEIERLDWSEVHLKDKEPFIEIKAAKAKTASRRLVPVPANLAAWLDKRQKEHGRVWGYENSAKQIAWLMEDVTEVRAMAAIHKAVAKLGKHWKQEELDAAHKARRKAERNTFAERREKAIKEGHKPPEEPLEQVTALPDGTEVKYQRAEWKKNALRHSYISYRLAEIHDVAKVALEAGNSSQIIFQHYRELVREKDAKAWFGILPAGE